MGVWRPLWSLLGSAEPAEILGHSQIFFSVLEFRLWEDMNKSLRHLQTWPLYDTTWAPLHKSFTPWVEEPKTLHTEVVQCLPPFEMLVFFFFFSVLGIELIALFLVGKCFITWACSQNVCFLVCFSESCAFAWVGLGQQSSYFYLLTSLAYMFGTMMPKSETLTLTQFLILIHLTSAFEQLLYALNGRQKLKIQE
jgi:hypothetical protein